LPECFAPTGRGPMKTQGFEARFSQNLAPVLIIYSPFCLSQYVAYTQRI
jgi:hypothetical protein